jgi:hypothetical protein
MYQVPYLANTTFATHYFFQHISKLKGVQPLHTLVFLVAINWLRAAE